MEPSIPVLWPSGVFSLSSNLSEFQLFEVLISQKVDLMVGMIYETKSMVLILSLNYPSIA
jgi:hypothetical protein